MSKIIILLITATMLAGCGQDEYVRSVDGSVYRVVEHCDKIRNPNYGRTSAKDILVGGTVGGVLGKKLGDTRASTVAGSVLGMIIASEPRDFYVNCREELRKVEQ